MFRKPPRILMINDHLYFGGGGDAVFRLEKACYEDAGFEVFTFSQSNGNRPRVTARDFIVTESKSHLFRKIGKFLAAPNVTVAFRETLQTIRPHFISVHLISKYPLSVYPQLKEYPAVQTLHGPNLFCATSWGCLKCGAPCELGIGIKCFMRGCTSITGATLYTFLYKRLLGSLKRNIDIFVCPSMHLQDSSESLGLTPTTFIPLGIDESFHKESINNHEGPPIVLFVGSLIKEKGLQVLLEAFSYVIANIPDAKLQIAGSGVMDKTFRKQTADIGLNGKVNFLGFVDHSKIIDLYRNASILVVPSIYKEQFGLVGPEALACGVPCVGSNIGGIPEWLHDKEWGFTVPPRDPKALAARIVTLLKSRDLRIKFGTKGRTWALAQYSPGKYKKNRLRLVEKYSIKRL